MGEMIQTLPTLSPNVETIENKERGDLVFWDLGGHEKIRSLWSTNYAGVNILVFVVDASDRDRLREAITCFQEICARSDIKTTPLLVLANKQDIAGAMSSDELRSALGVDDSKELGQRVKVLPSSASSAEGLAPTMEYISSIVDIPTTNNTNNGNNNNNDAVVWGGRERAKQEKWYYLFSLSEKEWGNGDAVEGDKTLE
eukprot:CAMPEP_0201521198 /NCGR_PEP_ID=MMETSP0161_2-20130828/14278_1 /ASSEMBLY_ACC=CAM_ASM_000251 /TAXON_ID=180227 /ORGANISM="Neoparamoeba aestuarina, Strain SoJaBio B1-5/56/2" /LENGTH=198 /DNA_ID=CAMNT_0047919787 /DNA_START=153 /DNA_END=747 /DNA_ORIENTATION=-